MDSPVKEIPSSRKLSKNEFQHLSEFIQSEYGIKLPPAKKIMLESRLQKRLRKLGIQEFSEYIDYVFTPEGTASELVNMVDVITTNKTDFFREPHHFEYLTETALPQLIQLDQAGVRRPLKVWSAGCSSGEEPYTLAIVLSEFAEAHPPFTFNILATDLSSRVLEAGSLGIYEKHKIEPIPLNLRKKYLLRSKDSNLDIVRIAPVLRGKAHFKRLNLLEEHYPLHEIMDIIFFRNVIIYFSRGNQEKIINRICRHLRPGGYIFMGHSETLVNMNVPLQQVRPTIYRRLERSKA